MINNHHHHHHHHHESHTMTFYPNDPPQRPGGDHSPTRGLLCVRQCPYMWSGVCGAPKHWVTLPYVWVRVRVRVRELIIRSYSQLYDLIASYMILLLYLHGRHNTISLQIPKACIRPYRQLYDPIASYITNPSSVGVLKNTSVLVSCSQL